MTVTATNRKNSFPTNGVTVDFPFTFSVNTDSQVKALTRATDGTEADYTNFTVALNPSVEGGTLTTGDVLNDVTLVVYRDTALNQQTDYVPGGRFPADSHEAALDKLTQISQEQQEEIDRSLKSNISDVNPPSLEEYDASVNARDAATLAAANDYTNNQVFEAGSISPDSLGGLTNYQAASVGDMIAGLTTGGETIPPALGQTWSSGRTAWKRTGVGAVITDFEALTPVNAKDYGSDGAALNWANSLPYDIVIDGEFTSDENVFFTRSNRKYHHINYPKIRFTSAPTPRVLTDREPSGDAAISVGVIFGGTALEATGYLTIESTASMDYSGIAYTTQAAKFKLRTSGSANGFIIDATGSDRNTYLQGLIPEVTFTGGSNEVSVKDCDFYDGFGVVGTTRNPDDYTSSTWLWSWAGVSDLLVEGCRVEGLVLDAAMKNSAKAIQSITFVGGSLRQGNITLDRVNRVTFMGQYGESASNILSTTERTGQISFISAGYQHQQQINPNTEVIADIGWFNDITLKSVKISGTNVAPITDLGVSLGSGSFSYAENNVARVNTDRIEPLKTANIQFYEWLYTNTVFRPLADGTQNIGTGSYRVGTINLVNAPSVTSDARYKEVHDVSEAEERAASKIVKIKFRYNESIDAKGQKARYHFGYSAQQIIESFESEGLNPFDYALLRKVPLDDDFGGDIDDLEESQYRLEVLVDQVNALKA